jgi:RNA polymerase sigma-70 factor (ECF subfamily)
MARPSSTAPDAPEAPGASAGSREIDAETLALCKAGDAAAFARFVRHYERPVFSLLARVMGPRADLEDLAQEAFLRAFQALPRFDVGGPATVTTWLLTIATRLALNDRRRPRSLFAPLGSADTADASTPEHARAAAELARAIERAAATLPIDQRAAFVLAEFHDLTMADIARALAIPENTAKTRVFRAREKMRELLLPYWSDR